MSPIRVLDMYSHYLQVVKGALYLLKDSGKTGVVLFLHKGSASVYAPHLEASLTPIVFNAQGDNLCDEGGNH